MCFKQEPIETIEYEMVTLKIEYDDCGESPREWDNAGRMVCWHRRYNLGDKHNFADTEDLFRYIAIEIDPDLEAKIDRLEYIPYDWSRTSAEWDEHDRKVKSKVDALIDKTLAKGATILPLYLYDHSGITMRTGPFSCPWDSGQVGWIYITHEQAKKEFGWKKLTKKRLKLVEKYLKGEVETYDDFLTGNVYFFNIEDKDGEHLDSCGGFYGYEYCLQEAKGVAERMNVRMYCEMQRDRLEDERQNAIDEKRRERKKQAFTELQLAVI